MDHIAFVLCLVVLGTVVFAEMWPGSLSTPKENLRMFDGPPGNIDSHGYQAHCHHFTGRITHVMAPLPVPDPITNDNA